MQTPGRAVEPQTPMVPLERRMDSAYERLLTRAQENVVERPQIRGLGRIVLEMEQLNNNMRSIQSEIQRDIIARRKYFEAEQKLLKKDIEQQQGFQTAALFDLRKTIGLASFGIAANELAQGDIAGAAQGIGLGITSFLPEIAQGVIGILAARGLIGGGLGGGLGRGGMLQGGLGMLSGGGKGKVILALASVGALLLTGRALAGGRSDTKRLRTIQESKKDPLLKESDVGRFSRQLTRFNTALVDIEETKEKEAESTISPVEVSDATASKVKSDNKSSDQEPVVSADQSKSTIIPPSDTTPDVMDDNVTERDVNQEAERIGLNKGGQVPGSGNTDTVPAMLTPGEVVMSKPAVDAIGADKLLALNAAGGGTNKPNIGYRHGQVNPDLLVTSSSRLVDRQTSKFSTKDRGLLDRLLNRDFESFEERDLGRGLPGMSMKTIEKFRTTEGGETLTGQSTLIEDIASVGIPDILEHQDDLMKRINAVKGFEDKTIDDVINRTVGMDAQQYTRLLNRSDAARATEKKREEAMRLDKEAGIDPFNRVVQGFQGGGLVGGGKGSIAKNIEPVESKSGGIAPLIINQGGKVQEMSSPPPVPSNITGNVDVSTLFQGSIDKLESAYALQTYAAFG